MRRQVVQADEKFTVPTPVGDISVYIRNEKVVQVDYASRTRATSKKLSPCAARIKKQIQSYFQSAAHKFDLPLETDGTDFQKRVWRLLRTIPTGKTLTYGEIAKRLHTSPRAVGNACRTNPVPLIVPCHRVVAKEGIGGFGGKTEGANISRKRWLLNHEGAISA